MQDDGNYDGRRAKIKDSLRVKIGRATGREAPMGSPKG
jgi:hypothetical protein